MAKRGFFAEMQHQAKVSAREAERAQAARMRQHAAAVREAERAQKAAERADAQAQRSSEAERKRLEKEARDAHVAAMQATVDARNAELAETYEEIDSLLAATLDVDDHVDLEDLRQKRGASAIPAARPGAAGTAASAARRPSRAFLCRAGTTVGAVQPEEEARRERRRCSRCIRGRA